MEQAEPDLYNCRMCEAEGALIDRHYEQNKRRPSRAHGRFVRWFFRDAPRTRRYLSGEYSVEELDG